MKGIKNLKISKVAKALLVTGTISLALNSCNGYVDMKSITANELLNNSEVANVTIMDEMIDDGELKYCEDLNIIEAADKLERCMDIVDAISKENLEDVDKLEQLSNDYYESLLILLTEDKEPVMESIETIKKAAHYKGNDYLLLERKLNALKILNYLKNYCNDWVKENGKDISIKFMMAAEKCAIGSELNISTDDYSSIKIDKQTSTKEPESNYVEVGNKRYEIKNSSDELWNTQNYIYAVQIYKPENGKEFETYRKAINLGKITIAAGANVKNDSIEEQYTASYIKKNYIK